jgi:hypothetical protein
VKQSASSIYKIQIALSQQGMHRIKSFRVVRTSATIGVASFLFALLFFTLGAALVAAISLLVIPHHAATPAVAPSRLSGLLFFMAAPFVQGVAGFIFTAVFCWLYNLSARFTGGMQVNAVRLPESTAEASREQMR